MDVAAGAEGYSVERLRRQYLDFTGAKRDEIQEQILARHYYHGDQWSAAEARVLKARKQPISTNNLIARKLNGVVGVVTRLRQDPKAYPRTPKQEDGAEIATATIRYSLESNDWQTVDPETALCAGINGLGGIELKIEAGDRGDPDIGFDVVDPDSFFYDPRSFRPDFSDARYMGVSKFVDRETALSILPDKKEEIDALMTTGSELDTWQQQDRERKWIDVEEQRLRLVEHWYLVGNQWHWCMYCATTKLAGGVSPFVDERGRSVCKYVMFSANVDHAGDRYGFIRNMKSSQDKINTRDSKALHILNTRRIIMEKGAVESVEVARREAARPDGVVEVRPNARFDFDDAAKNAELQGQLLFLQQAIQEIEGFGPNPALLGDVANKSGRAISLLQQAGIAELGPFILAYRGWKLRVYRAIWNAQQQFWTSERWLRVTDNEGMAQFLQLNGLQLDQQTGMPVLVNALGALDVDVILDEGPDTLNIMQDVYDTLVALAQNGAAVPPEALIEASSLPSSEKKKIVEMIERGRQPPPEAQQAAQIELAQGAAKVKETEANTILKLSQAGQSQAPAQGQPGPTPVETLESMAKVEETRANTVLKYAQAEKVAVETRLAPAQMQQQADAARMRFQPQNRP
jgi:hypothetical protein